MAKKTLSALKEEMLFNSDLHHLVDVMKGIAAAQYHVMERNCTKLENYSAALENLFEAYDFRRAKHPFIRAQNDKKLICLVTTDFGFLGGLNMKVMQEGFLHAGEGDYFFVIGEKGAQALKEEGKEFTGFPGITIDAARFELVERVVLKMKEFIIRHKFSKLLLVYPRSFAFTTQKIEVLNLVPCPIFFKNKPKVAPPPELQKKRIILESTPAEVIEYLTFLWIRRKLIDCFESAKLAEFGARTMHLEESYQTITKIEKALKLQYFKARREKIDQSLRETFTSQLICK